MHSGSSISPKHPAIPVSIGIASLVLEGRSSALDDSSINASATVCTTSNLTVGGHGTGSGGGAGGGASTGSSGAAGGDDEEDGGFCRQRRTSESTGGASSLQQCSLMAINESQKSLAMTCCHTPNETQRINLKLQQIRSSCPSTSKNEVQQLVTVSGEPNRLSSGRSHEREMYESFPKVVSQHDPVARGSSSSSSSATSWYSNELPISTATAGVVIYSGFEKMNVLGTVSPIKNHPIGNSFINFSSSSSVSAVPSSSVSSAQPRKPALGYAASKQQTPSSPREGPHCEQFLKKIGLTKPETADGPEHHCSYRNKYCLRWQVYFKQLSSILTNGEAVCIEVYLGPENHTILLEQWILKLVMTKSPATMTIQSLCAAIRSQLYFSQISAWTDLIKKSLEPDIFSHPRIKKIIPAAVCKAGGGSSFSLPQAKLDILFRIRTYDNTACFNEKPNVHNFPDASVAENFVIQVCLKSLPRLDRIPGINAALDAAKMIACLQKQQQVDRIPLPCHEKGKHRCAFRVELEEEEDEYDPSMVEGVADGDLADGDGTEDSLLLTSAAISHREKQLLKYRKRMLKREKKKKSGGAGEGNSNGSATSSNTSSSVGGSVSDRNGSSTDGSSYLSAKSYVSGQAGTIGLNVGSRNSSTVAGSVAFNNVVSVNANDGCSNGTCRNALTSSINSIQPPLYSSNDHQQAMLICDDRFHPVATNSKSTQTVTSGLSVDMLPPVVSVATQTDPTVLEAPVCNDCNNRAREKNGTASESSTMVDNPVRQGTEVSQNINHASSSISSTNRDRYMQYFNDYYRTYNIINENCDKGPAAPETYVKQARNDVPMDEGNSSSVQKPGADCAGMSSFDMPNTTVRRPCFIVGGDGYDGDEDDDSNTQKRNRAIANDSPILQQGELLLQAIQRTAMLNGSGEQHNEQQDIAKNGHGHTALNNNNYTTANNNIVECETVNGGSGGVQVANSMQHDQQIEAKHKEKDDRDSMKLAAKCESSECDTFSKEKKLDLGDCRLCKRQKTKHNFKLNLTTLLSTSLAPPTGPPAVSFSSKKESVKKNMITTNTVLDCGSTPPGCRRTLSESLVGHLTIPGSSSTASAINGHSAARCEGSDGDVHSIHGLNEDHGMLYPNGEDLSPSDSPMLSSSTGTVGNGVFTFEQMKSYRRAFSEDVIDTITTLGTRSYAINDRNQATEEDSTEEDGSNGGDNENDHVFSKERTSRKACGYAADHRLTNDEHSHVLGTIGKCIHQIPRCHRPHTSTPAAANDKDCKEPLYISCSETDCSVSTASSVSPHKKQILSCTAIGNSSFAATRLSSEANAVNRKEECCSSIKQQLIQQKPSSKINLNYVFCLSPLARDDSGFTSGSSPATSTSFPATSPIAIDGGGTFGHGTKSARSVNGAFSTGLFRYDFEEIPVSPVTGTIKSKSAPAFPFSPPSGGGALSPRFLRNAQRQFQHRTRYPSERSSFSERSSIGSDEQLSDDDLSSYLLDSSNGGSYCSPLSGHQLPIEDGTVGSALKTGRYTARSPACLLPTAQMLSKVLNRNLFKFGRAPMLGTLEESLLQRRLAPKFQVADFKVLLGASGSFCPTQLTIPAASYFYELPGQHLTTPYVCELRLPRKGYSIPRTGTVQATLLNPLGTVVRMFVVPYDFRDMPAMSTTFIRQRILACDDSSLKLLGKNIEQLSNAEQMKLLRYAIHLRFQTSRSGKLSLHTDIRLLISRRTDCDTAAAHAKNLLESPNELKVVTIIPDSPKFSLRIDKQQ